MDGPDTRYGQLYRGITKDAFKAAGVSGFSPHNPFSGIKLDQNPKPMPVAARVAVLTAGPDGTFPTMPTLAELNADLVHWHDEEINAAMYPIPDDPLRPTYLMPVKAAPGAKAKGGAPSISELHADLMCSNEKLFFIATALPGTDAPEWHLVSVAYEDTMSLHPNCLRDGKFLVDYYI